MDEWLASRPRMAERTIQMSQHDEQIDLMECMEKLKAEKESRIKYQDIVYALCSEMDRYFNRSVTRGEGTTIETLLSSVESIWLGCAAKDDVLSRCEEMLKYVYRNHLHSYTRMGVDLEEIEEVMSPTIGADLMGELERHRAALKELSKTVVSKAGGYTFVLPTYGDAVCQIAKQSLTPKEPTK